jgi:hypothetical protein
MSEIIRAILIASHTPFTVSSGKAQRSPPTSLPQHAGGVGGGEVALSTSVPPWLLALALLSLLTSYGSRSVYVDSEATREEWQCPRPPCLGIGSPPLNPREP